MASIQSKSNKRCAGAWAEIDEALDEIPSLRTAILYTLKFMLVSSNLGPWFTFAIFFVQVTGFICFVLVLLVWRQE